MFISEFIYRLTMDRVYKLAMFPGSFDPFTVGHEEVVRRGLKMFDRIVVAIGSNATKKSFMDIDGRVNLIREVFKDTDRVEVRTYSGLTVDFCREVGATVIIRGLRRVSDFEYEWAIGQANRAMNPEVETVFILTATENTFISSTVVRDIYTNGGNVDSLLPSGIRTEDLGRFKVKNIPQ